MFTYKWNYSLDHVWMTAAVQGIENTNTVSYVICPQKKLLAGIWKNQIKMNSFGFQN